MTRWLLSIVLGVCLGSAALAGGPVPDEAAVAEMSAGEYARVLVVGEYSEVEGRVAEGRAAAMSGRPEEMEGRFIQLENDIAAARDRVSAFPPFRVDDGYLVGEVLKTFDAWKDLAGRERKRVVPLLLSAPRSDADIRRYETVRLELDEQWRRSNHPVQLAMETHASQYGLTLTDGNGAFVARSYDDSLGELDFTAPGVPPDDSSLKPSEWVGRAIAYHNALYQLAGDLAGTMNVAVSKMNTPEFDAARISALEQLGPLKLQAESFGAVGGDDAFAQAVQAYARWMILELEGPLASYAEMTASGKVTPEEAERLKAMSDALSEDGARLSDAVFEARKAYLDRWQVEAYVAWRKKGA